MVLVEAYRLIPQQIIGMGLMVLGAVALPNGERDSGLATTTVSIHKHQNWSQTLTISQSSPLAPATTGGVMSPILPANASATGHYLGASSSPIGSSHSDSIKTPDSIQYYPYCAGSKSVAFCQTQGYEYYCDYYANLYVHENGPSGLYPECQANYEGGYCYCVSNCPGAPCNGT